MKAKLKVEVIDRYREPRKIEVPMTDAERKEYRRLHPKSKQEDWVKIITEPYYLGRAGDTVTIITEDPGAWRQVVSVENAKGDRFAINWEQLNTDNATK